MTFDFRAWLNVTPEQQQTSLNTIRDIAEEPAASDKQERINFAWAQFGHAVSQRVAHEDYQKIITYALLANASPQLLGKFVKDYVLTGKTPWQS